MIRDVSLLYMIIVEKKRTFAKERNRSLTVFGISVTINTMELLKKIYFKFLDVSQTILFIVSIFLVLYIFVLQPHEVSGSSMFPTFKDKEFLFGYLLDVKTHNLRQGDVVVFHSPVEEDKLYIKRIIAMPGDSIKVENGGVYVNNQKLDETAYLSSEVATYGGSSLRDGEAKVVPDGMLFVMGDNRPYSSDSREWGFLPYEKLVGRSTVRFWPLNTFTVIPRDPYE